MVEPLLAFNHVELYLACNLGISDDVIARLHAASAAMVKGGTTITIEQRYQR
jgi:polar amino acid transport system substrate-binding protein